MSKKLERLRGILENAIKEIKDIGIEGQDALIARETIKDMENQIQIIDVIQTNRKIDAIVIDESTK